MVVVGFLSRLLCCAGAANDEKSKQSYVADGPAFILRAMTSALFNIRLCLKTVRCGGYFDRYDSATAQSINDTSRGREYLLNKNSLKYRALGIATLYY